ncbi:hypothetical protein NQ317_006363 [Molorchus minor]|uniref:Uncharacterized protein n=1 Tax=Molorchus minor TaxID=1323400 RepID=A0ABQ9JPP1_9CUCU|nr:hypothetical protein NQ317_006363 [Molorchus minor]
MQFQFVYYSKKSFNYKYYLFLFRRHLCMDQKKNDQPIKTKQAYCKPYFRNYSVKCFGNQICQGVRLVYETHYKDVIATANSNEVTYSCCPGWTQISNRSHGCNKPTCSRPCLNGGKCVKPELCACLRGFSGVQCEIVANEVACSNPCLNGGVCVHGGMCSCLKGYGGPQCEINLNTPHCSRRCENGGTCARHEVCRCPKGYTGRYCEQDVDECKEEKPCDQICYNTPGSYKCQCREDFVLHSDGQSCRKEGGDEGIEAKDLEFEILDKRLLKLETENYKSDLHVFKSKLTTIEKKTEKVDDLMSKYDRMRKCAVYNKICL